MTRGWPLDVGPCSVPAATSNMKNANTREYLDALVSKVLEYLSSVRPVPATAFGAATAPQAQQGELPEEDPDVRGGGMAHEDRRVAHQNEMEPGSDDEDDKPARYEYDPREDKLYAGPRRPADLADQAAANGGASAAPAVKPEEEEEAAVPSGEPAPEAHEALPAAEDEAGAGDEDAGMDDAPPA